MSSHFLPSNRRSRYHRIIVPVKLRSFFQGRSQVWRSLKTTDPDEAKARAAQWNARAKTLFATLKREGRLMTQDQIDRLVEFLT